MVKVPLLRRNIQQTLHCVSEALAVVENDEDPQQAIDDLEHAQGLIEASLKKLRRERQRAFPMDVGL